MTNMHYWGGDIVEQNRSKFAKTLKEAVEKLPATVKQAFYAAAKRGPIQQGTWNGCAFNAGGVEIDKVVNSSQTAAEAFGIPVTLVDDFISQWDNYKVGCKDHTTTDDLISILEEVGIFTNPEQPKKSDRKIYRQVVFTGNMPEAILLEEFKQACDNIEEEIAGWFEAATLLFEDTINDGNNHLANA